MSELDPGDGTWSTYGSGSGSGIGERMHGVTYVEALALDADGTVGVGGTSNPAGGAPSCSIACYQR